MLLDHGPGGRTSTTGTTTVSIAMCTYNGARFVGEQLQSFLRQSRLPDQLVVCDDCSQDGTQELLQGFAHTAPFPVELRFNEHNLGVTRNFAQAIGACRGEIIALSDQDDVWHPEKLSQLVTLFDEHPQSGYVCSDAGLIDENGRALCGRLWEQWYISPVELLEQDGDGTGRQLLKYNCITGCTMAFRARLRPRLIPIPTSWVHDHWICTVCELLGEHGVATPELLVSYRLHARQVCGTTQRKHRRTSWRRCHRVTCSCRCSCGPRPSPC